MREDSLKQASAAVQRRELHFESLDEILREAEALASRPTRQLGGWTLGQILKHLAMTMNISIDGTSFRPPWLIRAILPLFKKWVISRPMRPGFKMAKGMHRDFMPPQQVSTEEGLAALRDAIARLKNDPHRAPSAAFGRLTREQWDQLHQRHAELHLSFIVPVEAAETTI